MRGRLVPGVLALCLALAACSGGEGEPAPTLEPLAESATPTPTAPAVPSEAAAATPEGAAEFVRYFFDRVETAYAERDPSLIEPLVDEACAPCQRVIDAVTRLRDEEARVEGYRIDVVEAASPAASETASVTTLLNFSEFVRTDASGSVTRNEPARAGVVQELQLIRSGETWIVASVTES